MNVNSYFENIKTYKYIANKSLGQNFLINPEIAEKIVAKLELNDQDNALEIGAGLGSLSIFLADHKCQINLIDIDERMLAYLNENFKDFENIKIRRQNILKEDVSKYTKIVGNLPYYITSGIIEHLLINAKCAQKIVLMCQKEVYPKLLSSFISPLSLLLNHICEISAPINVGRNNFTPVPHVDSVVFVLTPNENIIKPDNGELLKLMQQLFLHRRKTILNCLQNVVRSKQKAEEILRLCSIDFNLRPEQLKIESYISLLKALKS